MAFEHSGLAGGAKSPRCRVGLCKPQVTCWTGHCIVSRHLSKVAASERLAARNTCDFPPVGHRSQHTLIALTLASSVTNLGNSFVQDDIPIVKTNLLVHSLRIWQLFTQAYWPSPYPRELYRPMTSSMLAMEWVVGGGRPVVFRIVSILLYLGAALAVYRLAQRVLAPGAAWLAAALFAIHPVHVEAVAVAVNQAELVVGALDGAPGHSELHRPAPRSGQSAHGPRWIVPCWRSAISGRSPVQGTCASPRLP